MSDDTVTINPLTKEKLTAPMGAVLIKKGEQEEEENATKAASPRRLTVDALADDAAVLERARKLRGEIKK